MFKLGVYACLGLFVSWVLLLILQLWFSFVDADLFLKITLTMAGLFIIILASLGSAMYALSETLTQHPCSIDKAV